ncbi:GNAT family N-acetyltransferase [Listeria welshimeri]|nr:GNAT family N-acetyltransferase [Listeria welshimeri]
MEIRIQKPTSADFPFIEWLWADKATTELLGGPFAFPEEMRADWLKSKNLTANAYFIIKKGSESVGEVSFRDFEKGTAWLNIKVAARFRGQQIAQKAMQLFLDFFQNECAGIVMLDEVRQENKAGIAFLLKFGFKIIEEREQTVLLKWVKAAGKEESNE